MLLSFAFTLVKQNTLNGWGAFKRVQLQIIASYFLDWVSQGLPPSSMQLGSASYDVCTSVGKMAPALMNYAQAQECGFKCCMWFQGSMCAARETKGNQTYEDPKPCGNQYSSTVHTHLRMDIYIYILFSSFLLNEFSEPGCLATRMIPVDIICLPFPRSFSVQVAAACKVLSRSSTPAAAAIASNNSSTYLRTFSWCLHPVGVQGLMVNQWLTYGNHVGAYG